MIQKPEIGSQNSKERGKHISPVRSFEDLHVFRRAYAVSLDIHRASLMFPRIEQFALANQMRRASKSVCANIAEGFARQRRSSAEFKRFLMIAVGSCDEMQVWTRYAADLGYIARAEASKWKRQYVELAKMLQSLSDSWK